MSESCLPEKERAGFLLQPTSVSRENLRAVACTARSLGTTPLRREKIKSPYDEAYNKIIRTPKIYVRKNRECGIGRPDPLGGWMRGAMWRLPKNATLASKGCGERRPRTGPENSTSERTVFECGNVVWGFSASERPQQSNTYNLSEMRMTSWRQVSSVGQWLFSVSK